MVSPVGFCLGDPVLWMPFWVKLWCVVDRVSTLVFLSHHREFPSGVHELFDLILYCCAFDIHLVRRLIFATRKKNLAVFANAPFESLLGYFLFYGVLFSRVSRFYLSTSPTT